MSETTIINDERIAHLERLVVSGKINGFERTELNLRHDLDTSLRDKAIAEQMCTNAYKALENAGHRVYVPTAMEHAKSQLIAEGVIKP